jgi:MoxR-like ATPase
MNPEQYATIAQAIEAEVAKAIIGQRELVRSVLTCLLCEGHALLEGVPGLGKTQLLKTLASTVDLEFSRIQFTPDLMPADIVGTQIIEDGEDGKRSFRFQKGPVFASFVLADEINRATPKTQSALLEAMAERTVTSGGTTRQLPRPFLVMATQNPLEQEGTYPLPEAQLDRFLVKALVPFPTAEELVGVVRLTTGSSTPSLQRVIDQQTLTEMVALTRSVPVAEHVIEHAVHLILATHPNQASAPDRVKTLVRFGGSPRGAQALILVGKVYALLDGRPNVSIADVRAAVPSVLRHRLGLGYEAASDGVTADDLLQDVLAAVAPPSSGVRGD